MIPEAEYLSRKTQLLAAGVDEREANVKAVLDYGLEKGNITAEEADMVLDCLQSFLSSHPGFAFLSPKERWKRGEKMGADERELWERIQPVLDKAQGIPPTTE